jgi:hypothetical protein
LRVLLQVEAGINKPNVDEHRRTPAVIYRTLLMACGLERTRRGRISGRKLLELNLHNGGERDINQPG